MKRCGSGRLGRRGFTLVEAALVAAIIGTLAALAFPSFKGLRQQARIQQAVSDMRRIDSEILAYLAANRALPPDLATVGLDKIRDPWGRPYVYLPLHTSQSAMSAASVNAVPPNARRDRFMRPLNQDFDLFSRGPDGAYKATVNSPTSQDDIVRAYNGTFFGEASEL